MWYSDSGSNTADHHPHKQMKHPKTIKEANALVNKCLLEMEQQGLVRRFIQNGKEVWDVTEKGRAIGNRGSN